MAIRDYICGDCGGQLEVKGYYDRYFICTECGLKNCYVRKKKTDTGVSKCEKLS